MQKGISLILCFAALTILGFVVFGTHGLAQLKNLAEESQRLEDENRRFKSTIVQLKNKIFAVQSDSYSLEQKVRTELGMAKEGEVIYVFPHKKEDLATIRPR